MKDYSVSGDFGEVKIYNTAVVPKHLESLDQVQMAGWHRVNSLYEINRPDGSRFDLIIATLSGTGKIRIGQNHYVARPGTIFVIPHEYSSGYCGSSDGLWEFQWLHYSGIHAESCTRDIVRTGKFYCRVGASELKHLFHPFESDAEKGWDKAFTDSEALNEILCLVLKKAVLPGQAQSPKKLIDDMIEYVEGREAFCLNDLVSRYYFSKEYLIRIFKNKTGLTPYQYWKTYRIKKSCIELENLNTPIKEVAQSLGYKTESHYVAQFKACLGITPAKYREEYLFFKKWL